jgi:hypothetical protein
MIFEHDTIKRSLWWFKVFWSDWNEQVIEISILKNDNDDDTDGCDIYSFKKIEFERLWSENNEKNFQIFRSFWAKSGSDLFEEKQSGFSSEQSEVVH